MNSDQRNPNPGNAPEQQGESERQQQMQDARDLGGIPKTATSGVDEAGRKPDPAQRVKPAESGSAATGQAQRSGTTAAPQAGAGDHRADEPAGKEDESPAESLGRAIGAPLSGEAAPREPRR